MTTKHLTQEQINLVPVSNWYKYGLECGHEVYCRIRINVPRTYHEHFIRCPKCQFLKAGPTNWTPVVKMEAVTDEHVLSVFDATAFIVPRRILRTDGTTREGRTIASGNPFPYTTAGSEVG